MGFTGCLNVVHVNPHKRFKAPHNRPQSVPEHRKTAQPSRMEREEKNMRKQGIDTAFDVRPLFRHID